MPDDVEVGVIGLVFLTPGVMKDPVWVANMRALLQSRPSARAHTTNLLCTHWIEEWDYGGAEVKNAPLDMQVCPIFVLVVHQCHC